MSEHYEKNPDVSIGNWFGSKLLLAIPGVHLIMLIVWAITCKRKSKRSYAIASLLWELVFLIVLVAVVMLFGKQILDWLNGIDLTHFGQQAAAAIPTPTPVPIG